MEYFFKVFYVGGIMDTYKLVLLSVIDYLIVKGNIQLIF